MVYKPGNCGFCKEPGWCVDALQTTVWGKKRDKSRWCPPFTVMAESGSAEEAGLETVKVVDSNAEAVADENDETSRAESSQDPNQKRECHDEAFWYRLCEHYKQYQEQNPDKNISQRAFLKSDAAAEVTGEPKDCRSFSRYWKRYEMGELNPDSTKKRRRQVGKRKMPFSHFGESFTGKMLKRIDTQEDDLRPPPKLLPLGSRVEKHDQSEIENSA